MLILVAKLSWVHQLIFKRKKINEKKTYFPYIFDVFSETGF